MGISGVVANSLCLWIPGAFYRRKGSVQVKGMWKTLLIRWQFLENSVLTGRFLFPIKPFPCRQGKAHNDQAHLVPVST